jgi:outer membrane protein assembly factor BamB
MSRWMTFIAAVALMASGAMAENWPRFRGPNGQGISTETGLPTQWSATENVAWKTPIPGQGWSSPIVWEDRVFLTSTTENGVICHVICLDRRSGKILWDKEVFTQKTTRKEGKNSYATPTPVTDGQRVYAFFSGGSAVALDFEGNVVWTNRENHFYSQHGMGASPLLWKDLLIVPFDWSNEGEDKLLGWQKPWEKSFVLALDTKTGKERWRGKRGMSRIAHVSPVIAEVDEKEQLLSGAGDVVQGFNLENGERIWSARSEGEGVVPSLVVAEGMVFSVSGFSGSPALRAMRLGGKGEVTATHMAWEEKKIVPMLSSPVYTNGMLFVVKENGTAACIDAKSGDVIWEKSIGGKFSASPVVAEGRVYFLSETGETTIIEAGREFKEIARNSVKDLCQASMAVSQKQLFIRTARDLYCIGR